MNYAAVTAIIASKKIRKIIVLMPTAQAECNGARFLLYIYRGSVHHSWGTNIYMCQHLILGCGVCKADRWYTSDANMPYATFHVGRSFW